MLQLYHYPFKASLRAISKIDSAFKYEQNPWLAGSLRRLTLLHLKIPKNMKKSLQAWRL